MSIYQACNSLLRTVLSASHILIYFKNGSNNIKHDFQCLVCIQTQDLYFLKYFVNKWFYPDFDVLIIYRATYNDDYSSSTSGTSQRYTLKSEYIFFFSSFFICKMWVKMLARYTSKCCVWIKGNNRHKNTFDIHLILT